MGWDADKGGQLSRQAAEPIAPDIAVNGVGGPHQAAGISEGTRATNRGPAVGGAFVCDELNMGGVAMGRERIRPEPGGRDSG
jgi:hypothetical protein